MVKRIDVLLQASSAKRRAARWWPLPSLSRAARVTEENHGVSNIARATLRATQAEQRELDHMKVAPLPDQGIDGQQALMSTLLAPCQPDPARRRLAEASQPGLTVRVLSSHIENVQGTLDGSRAGARARGVITVCGRFASYYRLMPSALCAARPALCQICRPPGTWRLPRPQ